MARLNPALAEALGASPRPRLAVVRVGGLGDTLLVLPALGLVRRLVPGARLTLVGSAWAEQILPLIDLPLRLVRFDGTTLTPLFAPDASSDPTGALGEADAAVVYTADPDDVFCANVRRLCPGPVLTRAVRPEGGVHAAVHFARAVAPAVRSTDQLPAPGLTGPPAEQTWAHSHLEERFGAAARPVAVHPGSGGRRKCWPPDHFARLIEWMGRPALLIEGPADGGPLAELRSALSGAVPVAVARGLSLRRLAALLSLCAGCVGNDSGVSHLSAGLGAPTVAVFGPTEPALWAPLGPAVRVVAGKAGTWPSVGAVLEAARDLFALE